jgi:glycosyltransferase involved in cell wall biosynthesis
VRVLVVSGIWPPDVGGPASHAPDVAAFLRERGHQVEVVVTASAVPAREDYPVRWITRSLPKGVIHARTGLEIARRAARADVVYTTGMFGRSSFGAALVRRPYVVKLTADPAFERARRRGIVGGNVDEFQSGSGSPAARVLRIARDTELKHAAHVFTPSDYLRELALSWGVDPGRVSVLPNPAPPLPALAPREELRRGFGLKGPALAFAGRLTAQKSLRVALEALARVDDVELLIAGEGNERGTLEQDVAELGLAERVRFLGALPRARVVELFAAADASILSSTWENFPHTVVEACSFRSAIPPRSATRSAATSATRSCGGACTRGRPHPSRGTRRIASSRSSSRRSGRSRVPWPGEQAPRPLRRPDPVPAAAVAEPRAEVRRAEPRVGRPRARICGLRLAGG